VAAGLLQLSSSDFAHNEGAMIRCGYSFNNDDDNSLRDHNMNDHIMNNDNNADNNDDNDNTNNVINNGNDTESSSALLRITNCSFSYQSGYPVFLMSTSGVQIDSSVFRGLRALYIGYSNKTIISNCTFNDARASIANCDDFLFLDSVFDGGDSQLTVEESVDVRFDSCVFNNATMG